MPNLDAIALAVALAGDAAVYQTLKIGYDNNSDDDIDDAGDDVAISEDFSGTSVTPLYDHAGNLIQDTRFVYVYDAWNRLVKVRSANDADGERSEREQSATGKADTEVRGRTATCPEGASTKRATGGVIQTAEYNGTGRRMQKVVSNSGEYDKTEVYLYEDGWKIAQINDGSGNMVQQFIHGTQYIDEVVMMRVKETGDPYLHQGERSDRESPATG